MRGLRKRLGARLACSLAESDAPYLKA
jgi:hypothetical protein